MALVVIIIVAFNIMKFRDGRKKMYLTGGLGLLNLFYQSIIHLYLY